MADARSGAETAAAYGDHRVEQSEKHLLRSLRLDAFFVVALVPQVVAGRVGGSGRATFVIRAAEELGDNAAPRAVAVEREAGEHFVRALDQRDAEVDIEIRIRDLKVTGAAVHPRFVRARV